MSNPEDFVSFEKALRDLALESAELKKLVSEGGIQAFREGDSMKFRREDLDSLKDDPSPELDDLAFVEDLEDDTGMVTEELSAEDTLLAEDDILDEPAPAASARSPQVRTARQRQQESSSSTGEPVWVTAVAILGGLVMLYGFMVIYSVALEQAPGGLTGMFASN